MKVYFINTVYGVGSTGRITSGLVELLRRNGHEGMAAYGFGNAPEGYAIQSRRQYYFHNLLSRLTGGEGCFSTRQTKRLVEQIRRYEPDVIHLHNLHGHYLDLRVLFAYLKKCGKPVVWTLHDCWAMTGHCPHFTVAGCDKWNTGCGGCPQLDMYPATLVDNTRTMWKRKREWFTGVKDLTIVTPSGWLGDLVGASFLKEYPVRVIHNGVDLAVFRPRESDFRKRYGCEDKFLLLGVAFDWGMRKGLDVFVELARRLPERFQIVLVGTNEQIDCQLPKEILSIHRTADQKQLAGIYTAADLFVNPTREEVFGLVNAEALACGTPVVTFRTGGCPEILDARCGSIVPWGDVGAMEREILRIEAQRPYKQADCLERAREFDADYKLKEYLRLYEETAPKDKR